MRLEVGNQYVDQRGYIVKIIAEYPYPDELDGIAYVGMAKTSGHRCTIFRTDGTPVLPPVCYKLIREYVPDYRIQRVVAVFSGPKLMLYETVEDARANLVGTRDLIGTFILDHTIRQGDSVCS